jgi:hypothetical protein
MRSIITRRTSVLVSASILPTVIPWGRRITSWGTLTPCQA